MITRYVGVFCAHDKCRHSIPLSSHRTDSPNTLELISTQLQKKESYVRSVD
jgi:hypothetical protein